MTGIIANSVYEYLEIYNLLPVELEGCGRNSRPTRQQDVVAMGNDVFQYVPATPHVRLKSNTH